MSHGNPVKFEEITPPEEGERITFVNGQLRVPNNPILPFITGDGTGPDISRASKRVLEAAVKKAHDDEKRLVWFPVPAGEESFRKSGEWLPEDTVRAIKHYFVAMKGPLTTPVGGGIRSLNVALRRRLDLYACVRPVRWIRGVPCPIKNPEKVDLVIFRENTEDVYAGIEWKRGTLEAERVINFLVEDMGKMVRRDSGIGVKPISKTGSRRLVRAAINYALDHNRRSITIMHKGNIMKFTEGAFREWGYEVAKEEFQGRVITEEEVNLAYNGRVPPKKILIKDRIADSMFQQVLLRPEEYDVIATTNLNGDYISDACVAMVGGLGMAPGANINYETSTALFEPTHGTAPKYANKDKVNPSSMILSGAMMLDYLGWHKAAKLVTEGIERTILNKTVTYDLERQIEGGKLLKCSQFAAAIIKNM